MRRVWLILLLVCGTRIGFAEEVPLPEGPALMQQVRAQLPPMPLRLEGFVRTRQGKVQQDRRLVTELHFGDSVPYASYTLSDTFGDLITKVQVSWPEGVPGFAQWDADGNPLPAPAPQDRVADTGLTWSDLALDFLWWPGAEVLGRDLVKTRNAILLRIPAPADREDLAELKLWVDERALFVVRAQFLDAKGKLLKEIEVDSIKQVREDFWMVKDLIIKDRANKSHMGIRFEDVIELGIRN
jgi:hypothetical protein